ncbi:MAG TPA: YbhB/YbcL family Raf kinase inhibitor-like protein [Acetobacteraceae bacterium]|nr:YbhB/YbcL family Raf kinase inhibitor-like protein [Acetobacteraceae bacterium]
MKRRALTMALAFALTVPAGAWSAESYLDLSSPHFQDGGTLAMKYGGNNPQSPGCTGENMSPALDWKNAPAGTKSFAIILYDPAGRPPVGFVHWFAYGIPATKTGFKENEAAGPPNGYLGGKSSANRPSYFGPCPPKGVKPHPYIFTLMAYDVAPDAVPAGLAPDEFARAVTETGGKMLQAVSLVSRYGH